MIAMRASITAIAVFALCNGAIASTDRSDERVANAAELFGSVQFDSEYEALALRYLAEALAEDPANREAQQLAEAIQRRRSEREEQERQRGQQQIDQREQERSSEEREDSRENNQQTDEEQEQAESADDRDDRVEQVEEQSTEDAPEQDPSEDEMTHEEALRLLDALEAQEKTPQVRPQKQSGSRGPRW